MDDNHKAQLPAEAPSAESDLQPKQISKGQDMAGREAGTVRKEEEMVGLNNQDLQNTTSISSSSQRETSTVADKVKEIIKHVCSQGSSPDREVKDHQTTKSDRGHPGIGGLDTMDVKSDESNLQQRVGGDIEKGEHRVDSGNKLQEKEGKGLLSKEKQSGESGAKVTSEGESSTKVTSEEESSAKVTSEGESSAKVTSEGESSTKVTSEGESSTKVTSEGESTSKVNQTSSAVKDTKCCYEAQFFGFTPMSFSDGMYNALLTYSWDLLEQAQLMIKKEFPDLVSTNTINKASEAITAKMIKCFERAFDKLELYIIDCIFRIPDNVVLPEDSIQEQYPNAPQQAAHLDSEIRELKEKIKAAKYMNAYLKQELVDIGVVQAELDKTLEFLQSFDKVVQNSDTPELAESLSFVSNKALQLKRLLVRIEETATISKKSRIDSAASVSADPPPMETNT